MLSSFSKEPQGKRITRYLAQNPISLRPTFSLMLPKYPVLLLVLVLGGCRPPDIENAHLVGTLTDRQTQQPIMGATLQVRTAYYKGGDYDSYNGYRDTTLTTTAQGQFTGSFPLLCYIAVTVKRMPQDTLIYAKEVFSKNIRVDAQL